MSDSPKVSVIVLNWNGVEHLPACLDSLGRQTYADFETILVDNGSTDGSQRLVRSRYPWVRLVELGENKGFCAGNNAGIRVAKGQYIALLNNDTEVEPNWLAALCAVLDENASVGFCASKMLNFDRRDIIDNAGDLYTTGCNALEIGRGSSDGPAFQSDYPVFGACAGAAIYRRSIFERVGLLDEDFFCIYEDLDLSFRAQLAGYSCRLAANAVVYHKLNGTIKKYPARHVFFSQRNIELVWLKNMPTRLMLKYLPHKALYTLGAFVHFARHGHAWTFVRAKCSALRLAPRMIGRRKAIQTSRLLTDSQLDATLCRDWVRAKGRKFIGRPVGAELQRTVH